MGTPLKLFISQPMSDKTDEEIVNERNNAIDTVKAVYGDRYEIQTIDSFFSKCPRGCNALWFLGKSLELLSVADIAYFCKDWDKYRGCKIEHQAAISYGIRVLEYKE